MASTTSSPLLNHECPGKDVDTAGTHQTVGWTKFPTSQDRQCPGHRQKNFTSKSSIINFYSSEIFEL